jgi:hypothetical protein
MKNRRAADLKEAGTRRMVGASLAKKVALFFSQKPRGQGGGDAEARQQRAGSKVGEEHHGAG